MPFLGGITGFFVTQKQRKEQKQQKQKLINKEGLGAREVALWATSPDP